MIGFWVHSNAQARDSTRRKDAGDVWRVRELCSSGRQRFGGTGKTDTRCVKIMRNTNRARYQQLRRGVWDYSCVVSAALVIDGYRRVVLWLFWRLQCFRVFSLHFLIFAFGRTGRRRALYDRIDRRRDRPDRPNTPPRRELRLLTTS